MTQLRIRTCAAAPTRAHKSMACHHELSRSLTPNRSCEACRYLVNTWPLAAPMNVNTSLSSKGYSRLVSRVPRRLRSASNGTASQAQTRGWGAEAQTDAMKARARIAFTSALLLATLRIAPAAPAVEVHTHPARLSRPPACLSRPSRPPVPTARPASWACEPKGPWA